jgi:chemotaxis protein CheD
MSITLINVGVAQIKDAQTPAILRTILGSCVGICIYERMKKLGGLAHILLPTDHTGGITPEKYADTAIPLLVEKLIKQGAKKEFMSAKIAGGSSMFKFAANVSLGQIGEKNIEETKKILEKLGIPLVEEDTGGSSGRVIDFFLEDGRLKVKSGGAEKYYYKN